MNDFGIFLPGREQPAIITSGREKAEELAERYPGAEVFPVECVNRVWIKKN